MKKKLAALAVTVSCAAAGLAGIVAPAQAAAPTACTASDASIYAVPGSIPGTSGELMNCRPVTVNQVTDGPSAGFTSWKVQYASKDALNKNVTVSGTLMVPKAKWTKSGTRPLIAFAPGTLGLGPQCALSKQLVDKYQDMYEGANLGSFLSAGFAVMATDGMGYQDGRVHQYIVGESNGHALLDGARAAFQVPGTGLDKKTKIGITGYSEGGHSSLWGAQLAKSYAPELNVAGAAAGGIPGDLKIVAKALNGGPWAGFMAAAIIGVNNAYPALPLDSLANPSGKAALAKVKTQCLIGTLGDNAGLAIEDVTTAGSSLDQLYLVKGTDGVSWGERIDAQKVGVGVGTNSSSKYQITFPVFQYRGFADEIIDAKAEEYARTSYCKAGVRTKWKQYPGEHLSTDLTAAADVTSWFNNRFTSIIPELGNC